MTTVAIPTNWSEDTDYDDRFLDIGSAAQAAESGSDWNTDRTTHDHGSFTSHTHVGDPHTHTMSGNVSTSTTTAACGTASGALVPSEVSHRQPVTNSFTQTIVYDSTAPTQSSTTAVFPAYRRIKVIKPDTQARDIPEDAMALFDSVGSLPTGWEISDGTDSTRPDMDGDFLFGATATDTIGNTGGAATHTHAMTNHSHSETGTHAHAQKTMGPADTAILGYGFSGLAFLRGISHHLMTLPAITAGSLDAAPTATVTGSASSEPKFNHAVPIINKSGAVDTPVGIIVGWVDAAANIPDNWAVCDGSGSTPDWVNEQLKMKTSGTLLTNQSSNTHEHTYAHGHTHSGSHQHLEIVVFFGDIVVIGGFGDLGLDSVLDAHGHTNLDSGSTTPTLQSASPVSGADDLRYNRRIMVLMRKTSNVAVDSRFSLGTHHRASKTVLTGGGRS